MATKTTKKPRRMGGIPRPERKPRAKQQTIADWGPPSIPELDKIAEEVREAQEERMRLAEEEADKQELLRLKIKEKGLTSYTTPDGYVVYVETTEKAKVRKKQPSEFVRDAEARREANGDGQ